jgi:adhesin transport system outer membrane protein
MGESLSENSSCLRVLLASVCCLAPSFLGGAGASAETLPEAVATAISQHPTVQQAIAAQRAAREEVGKEKSNYFPKISVSTAAGRVYGDNATSRGLSVTRGAGYSGMWEGSLTVSQMIFDGLKTPSLVGASKAKDQAAQSLISATHESLALQTSLSYLNVLRARESLSVLSAYKGTLDGYKDKIRKMVDEGAADDAELQQAEVITLELQNMIANFEGQVQSAGVEFAQLTGHMPESDLEKPLDVSSLIPATADEAVGYAVKHHPQLVSAEKQVDAAVLNADAERAVLFPSVTGELSSYRKDVDDLIGGEVEDDRALLRATWALSTGGGEFASVRKAKQEIAQTQAEKAATGRSVESSIRAAYANLETTTRQLGILTGRLAAEQKLLETYRAQFEGGKVRILQLLQAENQTMNAQIELLNAKYRQIAAQYSVLGGMARLQEGVSAPSAQKTK